ncbi:DUF4843 domain-containing protein [Chitinophaga sp.]|uniref:DUF4843 domain-containing protein n=1 Tax=Chitinophaga sp. TaxID=1869181 RepID=UPI0026296626|nr:DUF4843 domain-containing protein [uncultured Chitinophaga sp.]
MKKITKIIICLLAAGWLAGCEKGDDLLYKSDDGVYFDFSSSDLTNQRIDSVIYSFALFPDKSFDTILLPVRLSGNRTTAGRKVKVTLVAGKTTAQSGLHFKALESEYVLPADSGRFDIPVIIYNTDPLLAEKAVRLFLQLQPTGDFNTMFPKLDTAKIIFSNRLEKPLWWEIWQNDLGEYSRVKHELFIRVSGTNRLTEDRTDWQATPKVLYHTRRFRAFLANPKTWTEENPEEGYVVTPGANGTLEFYHSENTAKKYILTLNPADGRYYFTDEDGDPVI